MSVHDYQGKGCIKIVAFCKFIKFFKNRPVNTDFICCDILLEKFFIKGFEVYFFKFNFRFKVFSVEVSGDNNCFDFCEFAQMSDEIQQ